MLQLAWEMKQAGEEGVPLRGVVNLQKLDDPGGVVCAMMDYMHKKRLDLEVCIQPALAALFRIHVTFSFGGYFMLE